MSVCMCMCVCVFVPLASLECTGCSRSTYALFVEVSMVIMICSHGKGADGQVDASIWHTWVRARLFLPVCLPTEKKREGEVGLKKKKEKSSIKPKRMKEGKGKYRAFTE